MRLKHIAETAPVIHPVKVYESTAAKQKNTFQIRSLERGRLKFRFR